MGPSLEGDDHTIQQLQETLNRPYQRTYYNVLICIRGPFSRFCSRFLVDMSDMRLLVFLFEPQSISEEILSIFLPNTSTNWGNTARGLVVAVTEGKVILRKKANPKSQKEFCQR